VFLCDTKTIAAALFSNVAAAAQWAAQVTRRQEVFSLSHKN